RWGPERALPGWPAMRGERNGEGAAPAAPRADEPRQCKCRVSLGNGVQVARTVKALPRNAHRCRMGAVIECEMRYEGVRPVGLIGFLITIAESRQHMCVVCDRKQGRKIRKAAQQTR